MRTEESNQTQRTAVTILAIGLAAALAGDGYLISRSSQLDDELARTQNGAQTQLSKLNEATTTLLHQEQQRLNEVAQLMKKDVKGVSDSAHFAIRGARTEAQQSGEDLSAKLTEQREQIADELTQIQNTTGSKFNEFDADVGSIKTNVETVKANVTAAQNDISQTNSDLKRATGDMGAMSGLIATNSKDLDALRALGERNYFEFDLSKQQATKRVGDIVLSLKKADSKRNRFTMEVLADDRLVEKKDKTINEPVRLYVRGNMQPYEIVVNQVTKDRVTGYLAVPKVKIAGR